LKYYKDNWSEQFSVIYREDAKKNTWFYNGYERQWESCDKITRRGRLSYKKLTEKEVFIEIL